MIKKYCRINNGSLYQGILYADIVSLIISVEYASENTLRGSSAVIAKQLAAKNFQSNQPWGKIRYYFKDSD
jgi:hypothetical protein